MNSYCQNTLHQIEVAVQSIVQLIEQIEEQDLLKRPTPSKFSVGELLLHIVTIPKADLLIANNISEEQLSKFYEKQTYILTKQQLKYALLANYNELRAAYENYSEIELLELIPAYWGVTYTRYEWLIEIVAHLYHHRGQLHAMLTHCYNMKLEVALFE
ncbi:DinB family protein [Solibacillus sp. CAU 1738]|uniref:DinB family protein n=1 Tax=Solibacillus sp. CAU 1738 TaxID=3140363 RepID=UPI003261BA4F